jgi:hypothetical protein
MSQFPGDSSMMNTYMNLFFKSSHIHTENYLFCFVFGDNCTIYLQSVVFMPYPSCLYFPEDFFGSIFGIPSTSSVHGVSVMAFYGPRPKCGNKLVRIR